MTTSLRSPNFQFLAEHDPQLLEFAARAERYVLDDPNTALIKLRQLAEGLAEDAAAYDGLDLLPEDDFSDILRRLRRDDVITDEMADIFHGLRKAGNAAAHEGKGTRQEAVAQLKLAHRLAVWFHRAFRAPDYRPGPFALPNPAPAQSPEMKEELERLRKARWEAEREADATEDALRVAERARREAESRADRLYSELEAALALAEESEARREELARGHEATLARIRADRAATSEAERAARREQARAAAQAFDLSEDEARDAIDARLRAKGWEADAIVRTWHHDARPSEGRNMAIANVPVGGAVADYVLFHGLRAVAVIEAKRRNANLQAALDEAARHALNYEGHAGRPEIALVFASNGRPTGGEGDVTGGVWFRDLRTGATRVLADWPTPEELLAMT